MDDFDQYDHNGLISLAVRIEEILRSGGDRRIYKFNVTTADSTKVKLTVWDGSPASEVDWKLGDWYWLDDALIKKWSSDIELNASNKTTAERIKNSSRKFSRQGQQKSTETWPGQSKAYTSIVHTTNTYIDRKNMGRRARQKDFLSAFEQVVTTAIEIDADLILHTGNLFWSKSPNRSVVNSCRETLSRATNKGIPVGLVPGERDTTRTADIIGSFENDGLISPLEDGWHQFGSVGLFTCEHSSKHGIETFQESVPDDPSIYIAAFHETSVSPENDKQVRRLEKILRTNLSAILIGDRTDRVNRLNDNTRILSPGTPERIVGKRHVYESPPDPIFFQYDVKPSEFKINSHKTNARRIVGFDLEIPADNTEKAIDELLADQLPSDAAAVFEITGEKSPTAISKKEIQTIVEKHVSLARGYDERSNSKPEKDTPNITINVDTKKGSSDNQTPDYSDNSEKNTNTTQTSKSKNSSKKITCPVSYCSFQGSLSKVIHHVTEQDNKAHSWKSLGYQTSWDFRKEHTNNTKTQQTPKNSQGNENEPEEQESNLKEIPGVASTRGQELQKAGYADAEAVASAEVDELSAVPKISEETARCIQETAKYVCGHEDTVAAKLAERLDADHSEIAEAYASLAPAIVTPEEAKRSLKHLFSVSTDTSVLDLTEYSLKYRHFLFVEGFTAISEITQASIDDLTEAKYVGEDLAESIQETVGNLEQKNEIDQDSVTKIERDQSTSTALAATLDATETCIENDIAKLIEHGIDRVEAEVTVTAKYHPSLNTTSLWEIRSVGLLRGHHLYHAGFRTAADIVDASTDELAAVPLISESTARRAQESARSLWNGSADRSKQLQNEAKEDSQKIIGGAESETDESQRESSIAARSNFPEIESLSREKEFPSEMIERDQWLLWKETPDGRKIPRAPWETDYELQFVDAMDPINWTTFQNATEWLEKLPHDYELAFCLTRDDPIVFVDLDDVIRENTITVSAQEVVNKASSYTATSTSGTGLHIFVTGELSDEVKAITDELDDDNGSIEVYDRNRFVAITGDHIAFTPDTLISGSEFINYLESEYAQVSSENPDKVTTVPNRSKKELREIETTTDIQDLFDAITQTRPSDIRMRSSQTNERQDGSASYDPSWTTSESGTRLGVLDEIWIYRDGMIVLDALQIVALEEGIITDEREYPEGSDFWDAVEELRNRGASIPKYEPDTTSAEAQATDTAGALAPESEISQIINYGEPVRDYVHPSDRDYQEDLAIELSPVILNCVSALDLPAAVAYRTAEIYRSAHTANIVPGQSHECTIAAALRIASLESGTPRPWEEIGNVVDEDPKSVRNKLRRILKETHLSDSFNISDLIVKPKQYVPYVAKRLNIDIDSTTLEEAKTKVQQNTTGSGGNPLALAAGGLYAMLKQSDQYSVTQEDIAEAASVSSVTIRNNYKQFQ